ncbi:tRNA lysidine(34) synthetase TilS [Pediococcus pentosaceus]|uniref:tRNA lysidine(34) synthetase TilS n=1 Tax=Pediococcus pentosaceus TaxID=1255 RepID=UPI00200C39F2|nr:tRNA lysidine(34) synthetase TilS [Pediococcus pentosaceus]UQB00465.1 tRNA lysidine(34) synthetase TilS [Pediococcus pentosaceus]UQB02312.1 tRNA lysidine(34) synthetase TilS [Pediococcus pentosaceus]
MKIGELGDQIVEQYGLSQFKIVVAVSTGVDSTVLINALINSTKIKHQQLIVAHVNHQLREQSIEEERFLHKWCRQHQITFMETDWPKSQHPQHGVEAAAREFRYTFFKQVMHDQQAQVLLTAHNADEQAENFVMQVIRGGWLNQLNGIPERRTFAQGWLIRPFLKLTKQFLIETAQENKLRWFEDQTNRTTEFLRNRVRNEIIPAFRKENPRVVEHIQHYQDQLLEQSNLVDQVVLEKLTKLQRDESFDLLALRKESLPWQKKIILKIITEVNAEIAINENKLDELARLVNNTKQAQATIDIGKNYKFEITYNYLRIGKKITVKGEQVKKRVVTLNSWLNLDGDAQFQLSNQKSALDADETMVLSANQLRFPLFIRKINPNDRLRLKNGGYKTIRRELIDQKVPNEQRERYFAITDVDDEILWVPGLRKAWLKEPFLKDNQQFIMEFRIGGSPHGQ